MTYFSAYFLSIVLVVLTALTGMLFLPGAWYAALHKPLWTPPNLVFPIVWSTLYCIDMVVGGWVLVKKQSLLIFLWLLQLVFNGCWSWIVFGQHQLGWGVLDIGLLWVVLALFIYKAYKSNKVMAYLFVPYWLWVSMAATLNGMLWQLNP